MFDDLMNGHLEGVFYLIKKGIVDIFTKNKLVKSLQKYNYFCERSVLLQERNGFTAIASTETVC